jgi:hypothetical protein
MKKTLTTQKLICSVVMSAILSGCLPGSNIGGSSDVNNNATTYSNPEHLIDKDPNKKLSKEELYKKVSRDYENRPAKVDQKKVIDNTLVKLPWQLLYKHDDTNSSIERVASDWEGTLTRHSIEPNQRIKDMNGKDVAAKDLPAHLYRDNGKLKILVRADDGINYANNGENRKQLLYATIKAMLSGHKVELDGNFIQALDVEKSNRYLENNYVQELRENKDLTPEIINGIEYREIAENALAYLLVNYHEEPEGMTYFYPEMASYLDKFEHDRLGLIGECRGGAGACNKAEVHDRVVNLIKNKVSKSEHIGELEVDQKIWKDSKLYQLYKFNGIVFRGDERGPSDIKQAGFENPYTKELKTVISGQLDDPLSVISLSDDKRENLYTALGFSHQGSTNDVGISTSKTIQQAAKYPPRALRRYVYLIDSTQLNGYDIPSVTQQIDIDPNKFIPNDEVNMFDDIPSSAIIGYSYIEIQEMKNDDGRIIELLNNRIRKNDKYIPTPWALSLS